MVYVDDMRAKCRGMIMCHMIADTTEELIDMAVQIGVRPKWIQKQGQWDEHFDICLSKRELAVQSGAKEVTQRELVVILVKRREAAGSQ